MAVTFYNKDTNEQYGENRPSNSYIYGQQEDGTWVISNPNYGQPGQKQYIRIAANDPRVPRMPSEEVQDKQLSRFETAEERQKLNDEAVRRGWGQNAWWNLGKTMGKGAMAATIGAYTAPIWLPLVELYGGYEGIKNMTGEHGLNKTAQLFKTGDWQNGLWKLFGNDIHDAALAIPGIGRAKQFFGKGIPVELGDNLYKFGFGFKPLAPESSLSMEVPTVWFSKVGNIDLRAKYPNIVQYLEKDMSGKPIPEKTQKAIYDLLEDPKRYGMSLNEIEELEKTFAPGNSIGLDRKRQLITKINKIASDLENNIPIDAVGKAKQNIALSGEEPDFMNWVRDNIDYPNPNDFSGGYASGGASSRREYYGFNRSWFNNQKMGTGFMTGDQYSTDSVLDLLGGMSRLLRAKRVKFLPYRGNMTRTNHYGKRMAQEAVDDFNRQLKRLIEENPDINFGDIPEARVIPDQNNMIEIPELQFVKINPEPYKKGGKLKLIPRIKIWK